MSYFTYDDDFDEDDDYDSSRDRQIRDNPEWLDGSNETEEEYWDHTELD